MILFVILIMGLLGYNQLSRDSMPPFTIRVCSVVTQFPGASPDRVEELITDKIEKVAQETSGAKGCNKRIPHRPVNCECGTCG